MDWVRRYRKAPSCYLCDHGWGGNDYQFCCSYGLKDLPDDYHNLMKFLYEKGRQNKEMFDNGGICDYYECTND